MFSSDKCFQFFSSSCQVSSQIPFEPRFLISSRMAMSAEAIIGLIALFIACIPGIRFILRCRNKFRQFWNRHAGTVFHCLVCLILLYMSHTPSLIYPSISAESRVFAILHHAKVSDFLAPTT